jgi:phage terminase large subunit
VTTARKADVAKDRRLARPASLVEDLRAGLLELRHEQQTEQWPSPRWRSDPEAFGRAAFGLELFPDQVEIMRALVEHERVAVRSGNKAGKTLTVVLIALWFYCSFPDARVVMTATSAPQINRVLWRQLKALMRSALIEIPGKLGERAQTGLIASDLREVTGQTAAVVEAISGVSGANLLYVVDEASSLEQRFFEAIEGNRAGGSARVVMISNPTRIEGPYFEAFHQKKAFWHVVHINCEDVARWNETRKVPGIATQAMIDQWAEEYGKDSAFYRVRVRGEFPLHEAGKAISFPDIEAARARWEDAKGEGRLRIGDDPAGPGDGGDDHAFAIVRGSKCLDIISQAGLTDDQHIDRLLGLLRTNRLEGEKPLVLLDIEGPIGQRLFYRLQAIAGGARPGHDFELAGVKASDAARREPQIFVRTRDEVWANLARWIRADGAIPPDSLLEQELYAPSWLGRIDGKIQLTKKDEIKKLLRPSRSPDRADALALAVWEPLAWQAPPDLPPAPPEPESLEDEAARFDMQGGNDGWWPKD